MWKTFAAQVSLGALNRKQYRDLLVIQELYRQQFSMCEGKRQSTEHRISIGQPHVRPIVRGKSNARMAFGAKLSVSDKYVFSFLDVLQWDAYHEGSLLKDSVKA